MNNRDLQLRLDIMKTYKINGHCFKYGCGRETMSRWVEASTGNSYKKSEVRKKIIKMGFVKYQNKIGYSCFKEPEPEFWYDPINDEVKEVQWYLHTSDLIKCRIGNISLGYECRENFYRNRKEWIKLDVY